jgi:predicted acylesterase/phospholipase RssA
VARSLTAVDPNSLLLAPDEVASEVLRVILERTWTRSRPRARADEHVVCLAVEGGGMRGAVSAGMCVLLEAAGVVGAFDRIYGVSAGALNGCATAMGQAALGATYYQDASSSRVINPMRPLLGGGPVIDYDLLFDDLIATRKPWSFERLASGPEFRAIATSLETMSLRVLGDFADIGELVQAVRASAALPALGGDAPVFRGERMADGGLIEPIPFQTALLEGATHVLVLRSRPAAYRAPGLSGLGGSLAVRDEPGLGELIRARDRVYNHQAAELQRGDAQIGTGADLLQITVPDHTRVIRRLENNGGRITEALRYGAQAVASMILSEPVDLCWQPVVYRAAVVERPAGRPARAGSRWRAAKTEAGE